MSVTHYRRCIKIEAIDSPNVKLALWQIENGLPVTGEMVVPGVLSWEKYQHRLKTFTKQRITESLLAEWYAGAEEFLVPKEWLAAAQRYKHAGIRSSLSRGPRFMGVDSGEGGDDSAWCVIDRHGVLALDAMKTPDTNKAYGKTIEMMRRWDVPPERVIYDLGGGGKEHVDRLRANGFNVRGTRFGKQASLETKRTGTLTGFEERRGTREEVDAHVNRRSEMAYDVRLILERTEVIDPESGIITFEYVPKRWFGEAEGFELPMPLCEELCRQMALIPMDYDGEGRFKLLPKQNPHDPDDPKTLRSLMGRSPDHFDAFCLSVFGITHKPVRTVAGAG